MRRQIYLYGAGDVCKEALSLNLFDEYDIQGIFDTNCLKTDTYFMEYKIMFPKFIEEALVCVANIARAECVKTLLELGYRKFMVLLNLDGEWLLKEYDYSCYDDFEENPKKVFLLGRNLSGSNVYGLYKALEQSPRDGLRVVYSCGNLSDDIFYNIITSKVIVVEHDREILPKDKIVIQMWHGFGPKGSGFRNKLLKNETLMHKMINKWLNYDVVCSYSDTYSTIIGSCYCIPSYKMKVTGMPRNDVLLKSKHSFSEIIPECEGKKVLLYMPTFRQRPQGDPSGDERGYFYKFDGFDYDSFNEECKKRNIVFVIKHHAFDENKEIQNKSNIKFLTDSMMDIDFYEYLGNADLLLTDYSSVFTDFLLMNKPILFVGNDLGKYGKERGFLFEPIETWLPGPIVTDYDGLLPEAEKLLEDEMYFKEKRSIVKAVSHRYFDDKSGERIWDCICEVIDRQN